MTKKSNVGKKVNWLVTILLIIGCVTIFFPLYMTVMIAFKQPSEMTNDVAGALAPPSSWSFANFREAMEVTDFWNSLGNSLLITIVTVILSVLVCGIASYAIEHSVVYGIFEEYSYGIGGSGQGRWSIHMDYLLESYFSGNETYACYSGSFDCNVCLERCNDAVGDHVWNGKEYPASGTAELPESVWYKL